MKKIILAVLFSVFLLSAMTVPSLSQEVGVNVGDRFTYEGTWEHISDVAGGGTIPLQLVPYMFWNETDLVKRTVTDVTGTSVTFEIVTYYSNGTEATTTVVEDVSDAVNYLCIGANMEPGDEFTIDMTYAGGPLTITETLTIDYEDETRETNYHNSTTGAWAVVNRQYWFDKETGILVRAMLTAVYEGPEQYSTTETIVELVHTDLWVIPEYPIWTVMLLVLVAVTVSINLYIRKRLRH